MRQYSNTDTITVWPYIKLVIINLQVKEYVTPEKFDYWKKVGDELGFLYTASGPLVRSSYRAGQSIDKLL